LIADGKVLAPSVPIFAGDNKGSSFRILRKKRLAASRTRFAFRRKSIGLVLVDGTVQVTPLAADLDVGLVDPDRTTMRAPKLAQ